MSITEDSRGGVLWFGVKCIDFDLNYTVGGKKMRNNGQYGIDLDWWFIFHEARSVELDTRGQNTVK